MPDQMPSDDLTGHYTESIPASPGHYVYRLWAADGTCLYVGVTGIWRPQRVAARLGRHRSARGRGWLAKMTRIEVASFPNGSDAWVEEKRQIAALQPVYNKRGSTARRGIAL